MDEFGGKNQIKENVVQPENTVFRENAVIQENVPVQENVVQQETANEQVRSEKPKSKSEKKNHALNVMSGSMVAIIGAATVGITQMLNVTMSAEFASVEYKDGVISYVLNVKDLTEKEELHIDYYDADELKETVTVTDNGEVTGTFLVDTEALSERLAAGENVEVRYRLAVSGNVGLNVERKFDNFVVSVKKCLSKFENITGECHCGEDGYYWFYINFEDDNRVFTDWSAYIIDNKGVRRDIELTDDLHEVQKVYVLDLDSGGTIYLDYKMEGVQQETETLEVHF